MDFEGGRQVFIVNPAAGKGVAAEYIQKAVRPYFAANGGEYSVKVTAAPGDATAIARREATACGPVTLYACGGDGTLNEVITGAYGFDNARVACLPLGSGNDFVKSFGGRTAFLDIGAQMHGETMTLDLIHCNDRLAVNLCSMGFDAWAAYMMQTFKRWPLVNGKMSYQLGVAYCLISKMKNQFLIHIDGEKAAQGEHLLAIAANAKWYGGSFMAAPDADPGDGLLDFVIVRALTRRKFISIVGWYQRGEHDRLGDVIRHLRGKEMRVQSPKPFAVSIDGEIISTDDVTFSIEPHAIQVVKPSELSKIDKIFKELSIK